MTNERVLGVCPECKRGVGLVPGDHTMRGGPPTCPGAHINLMKFWETDDLPEGLEEQLRLRDKQVRASAIEDAARIAEETMCVNSVRELIAERIRALNSEGV